MDSLSPAVIEQLQRLGANFSKSDSQQKQLAGHTVPLPIIEFSSDVQWPRGVTYATKKGIRPCLNNLSFDIIAWFDTGEFPIKEEIPRPWAVIGIGHDTWCLIVAIDEKNPDPTVYQVDLASNDWTLQKGRSLSQFLAAIEREDTSGMAAEARAEICVHQGIWNQRFQQFDKAQQCYQRALALDPRCLPALHNRAVMYARQGNSEQAIINYNQVLEFDSQHVAARINRGNLHLQEGRIEQAEQDYQRVMEIDPQEFSAYYNLACLYALNDNFDDALQKLEQAWEKGYRNTAHILQDPDLENLRQTKKFKEWIQQCKE